MSEKPFHNATAKHPDVKALSINADNKEFRKFRIRMFQVEGLPTTVYLRKVEPSDSDYKEVADVVGVEGNATIVLSRKDVGSRNEEEFSKSIGALSPAAPKAKEEPKKQPVDVAEEAPEPKQVKKGRARFEREERPGRKKAAEAVAAK